MNKTLEATIDWVKRNYAYRPGEDDEYVGQLIEALEVAHRDARLDFADELTRKGVYSFDIHSIRKYAEEKL